MLEPRFGTVRSLSTLSARVSQRDQADAAAESAETVMDAAVTGHDYLRKFMEDNPHTTTLIALGIGLVIGYAAHRPPPRRNWWS